MSPTVPSFPLRRILIGIPGGSESQLGADERRCDLVEPLSVRLVAGDTQIPVHISRPASKRGCSAKRPAAAAADSRLCPATRRGQERRATRGARGSPAFAAVIVLSAGSRVSFSAGLAPPAAAAPKRCTRRSPRTRRRIFRSRGPAPLARAECRRASRTAPPARTGRTRSLGAGIRRRVQPHALPQATPEQPRRAAQPRRRAAAPRAARVAGLPAAAVVSNRASTSASCAPDGRSSSRAW